MHSGPEVWLEDEYLAEYVEDDNALDDLEPDPVRKSLLTVRLTRPRSAGDVRGRCANLHHLHIRELKVFDQHDCPLRLEVDSHSLSCAGAVGCIDPAVLSMHSTTSRVDHWMEFRVMVPAAQVSVTTVRRIEVYNRNDGCSVRLFGAYLDLKLHGKVVYRWVVTPEEREHRVIGSLQAIQTDQVPDPLPPHLSIEYWHRDATMMCLTAYVPDWYLDPSPQFRWYWLGHIISLRALVREQRCTVAVARAVDAAADGGGGGGEAQASEASLFEKAFSLPQDVFQIVFAFL